VSFRFDRTLGGMEFQLRLRNFLAERFNAVKKSKNDMMKDFRALQKLFKEAGRVKQVLSANVDHFAQV
jgi:hypoxia up-regulated 1